MNQQNNDYDRKKKCTFIFKGYEGRLGGGLKKDIWWATRKRRKKKRREIGQGGQRRGKREGKHQFFFLLQVNRIAPSPRSKERADMSHCCKRPWRPRLLLLFLDALPTEKAFWSLDDVARL